MKSNLCSYESGIRFVLGCVVLWRGIHFHSGWGWLGLAPLLTAVSGFCPLYWLLRIDTSSRENPT